MKEHRYSLRLLEASGNERIILDSEKSLARVRAVAMSIKIKPGRRVIISHDGKDLPKGASALDDQAYNDWLKSHS